MKKLILFIVLITVNYGAIHAQTNEEKKSVLHVSFIPPLSTHGNRAAEYTNGASFNILVGVSRNEQVFTFGGLANIIRNNANGLQFAGLANIIGNDGNGFLFGGLTNVVKNDYQGLQFAGLVNVTNNFKGLQFGGLANKAENVYGLQFASLVNIAKNVKGVQFAGLINIAENSDYPIGIINIIKNGEKAIGVSYNETGSVLASFRSGGRILYGIIGLGYNHKADKEHLAMEGGFGAHIPVVSRFRINTEIKSEFITKFSNSDDFVTKTGLSILPAFKILPQLEIFAGPSINYMETENLNNKDMFPGNNLWKKFDDRKLRQVFVGYTIGTHFIF